MFCESGEFDKDDTSSSDEESITSGYDQAEDVNM